MVGGSVSSQPARSAELVSGQPELHTQRNPVLNTNSPSPAPERTQLEQFPQSCGHAHQLHLIIPLGAMFGRYLSSIPGLQL